MAIRDLLVSEFYFPSKNTMLLLNDDATKDNILEAISDLTRMTEMNDRLLIYFSGHGATESLPNGGEKGYFLPVDSDPLDLPFSSISTEELQFISNAAKAKHILYLVDATFGGVAKIGDENNVNLIKLTDLDREDKMNKSRSTSIIPGENSYSSPTVYTPSAYINKIINEKGRQIITAGGRGEQVIEKSEWGHSAFTFNLLRALKELRADSNNDGFITGAELGDYLRIRVSFDTDGYQTPHVRRLSKDAGEFIFLRNDDINENEIAEHQQNQDPIITFENSDSIINLYTNDDPLVFINMDKEQLMTLLEISALKHKMDYYKESNPYEERFIVENGIYENSFAVIIGINKYKYSKSLKFAVKDAKDIKKLLVNKFGFNNDNIRLLLDSEATFSAIRQALYEIAGLAKKNDRLLIYFAGHGQTIITKSEKQIGYLIPVNGDINEPTLTGIPMDDIIRLCESNSKHILYLMDACYSGLMAEGTRGLDISKDEKYYFSTVTQLTARQIITAGNGKQEVLEGDEWQNSAFTFNLMNALNKWEADIDNSGYITASELGEYLIKSVSVATQGRQTPQLERIRMSESGEFIFFKNP